MSTKLALAIPTNEPEVALTLLLPSLHHLSAVADRVVMLFNFQKPWTESQIQQAVDMCKEAGIEVRYRFSEYNITEKGKVPVNLLRHDACSLMPEADYFMLADDDFTFQGKSNTTHVTSGEQILACLNYLDNHEKCGIILMKGKTYTKEIDRYSISPLPSLVARYVTDKGIILRNFNAEEGYITPLSSLGLVGSDEEKVASSWRLYNGYYPAGINYVNILHYENNTDSSSKRDLKVQSGERMYQWNRRKILAENNDKFIKENYNPGFINRGGTKTELVKYSTYLNNGGIDIIDESVREELTSVYYQP